MVDTMRGSNIRLIGWPEKDTRGNLNLMCQFLAQSSIASLTLGEKFLSPCHGLQGQTSLAPNYFSILAICSGMCQTYSHTRLSSRILPLEPACLTTLLHSDFCYNDVSSRRPPLTTQCNIVSHPHPCPALFCFLAYLIIYIIYIFFILYCFSSQCIDICLP